MTLAVFTLTRDRLDYTKHCFDLLERLAGVDYDHYVLDQGSTDGTKEWLQERLQAGALKVFVDEPENIGISRGLNKLIGYSGTSYDWYLKFDNDCELTEPDQVARVIRAADGAPLLLSPKVEGLREPPGISDTVQRNGERLGILGQIGGIFMLIPGWVYRKFKYNEANPIWGMDDVELSWWFHSSGGTIAYLLDSHVNHYMTTDGQHAHYPDYFKRKLDEMGRHDHS